MESSRGMKHLFCPNRECRDYRKKGLGNISVCDRYGKGRRKLLKCRTCAMKFSEMRMRFSFGLHTDEGTVREVISCLMAGKSLRETAAYLRIDKDTVHRIWKKFRSYCQESMGTLLEEFNLELEDIFALLQKRSGRAVGWTRAYQGRVASMGREVKGAKHLAEG
jgi:hypothetical protein